MNENNEKNQTIQQYLENFITIKSTEHSLRKATKKPKNKVTEEIPPIKKINRSWVKVNKEKVEFLCNTSQSIPTYSSLTPDKTSNIIRDQGFHAKNWNLKKVAIINITYIFNKTLRSGHLSRGKVSQLIFILYTAKQIEEITSSDKPSADIIEKLFLKKLQHVLEVNSIIPPIWRSKLLCHHWTSTLPGGGHKQNF